MKKNFLALQQIYHEEQTYLVRVTFLLAKEAMKVALKTRKATAVQLKAEMKKSGDTILNLLLMRISINPLGLQLFLQPQPLLVVFST